MILFPIKVTDLMLTEDCNMACKYCFEKQKSKNSMSLENLIEYFSKNRCLDCYPFGGEPLLAIDTYLQFIDYMETQKFPEKERFMKGLKSVVTNGTLIKPNIEKLKKYDIEVQISMDGSKEIHDKNRVFKDGTGTYDIALEAYQLCVENKISCSIHGVISKENIPHMYEIAKWHFETVKEIKSLDAAIVSTGMNSGMIVFEEEYTDADVDEFVHQFQLIAEWIFNMELGLNTRMGIFKSFFLRRGGVCGVGSALIGLDHKLNMYPCHRLTLNEYRDDVYLGNVMDIETLQNYNLLNSLVNVGLKNSYMYSAIGYNDNFKNSQKLHNHRHWCPATNYETSGNIYYETSKYSVLIAELNRAIEKIWESYCGNIPVIEKRGRI